MLDVRILSPALRVGDLVKGYKDSTKVDGSVIAYDGKLQVRPPYQREFVYKEKERDAVVRTLYNGLPLNVMYWAKNKDGTYEVLDGQQRIISFCQFRHDPISVKLGDKVYSFDDLGANQDLLFLNRELMIYICEGTTEEILDWFETINIAGKPLSSQELRSAAYHGSWVTAAKIYFVRKTSTIHATAGKYLAGSVERQDWFETALLWHIDRENTKIDELKIRGYMSNHRHESTAKELIDYFESVIDWVDKAFPNPDSEVLKLMKGLPWGVWYNQYGPNGRTPKKLNPQTLKTEIQRLMGYEEINKKGIFEYLLTGDAKHLNERKFSDDIRLTVYNRQGGRCVGYDELGNSVGCGKDFPISEMHADHIKPWTKGGTTTVDNCQMLCAACNMSKGAQNKG